MDININIWGFLSVAIIFGVSFAMFVIYLNHMKTMKKMEIEALKNKNESSQTGIEKPN